MDGGIRQWTAQFWLDRADYAESPVLDEPDRGLHWWAAVLASAVVAIWFVASLLTSSARLVISSRDLHLGFEATSAFARLFGALVLVLIATGPFTTTLRWIALGFGVLGISSLIFGFVPSLRGEPLSFNSSLYISKFLWLSAGVMMLIGLVPRPPPPLSRNLALLLIVLVPLGPALIEATSITLPALIEETGIPAEVRRNEAVLSGMSAWHWIVSLLTLGVAVAALIAAATHRSRHLLNGWLIVAIMLFAGAQLHDIRFPSSFGPIVTTADILELASAGIICVAGILELRRFGDEHAKLLELERESSHNLRQLSMLKSDFTAMIAHELGNPLAAIRRQTELLSFKHHDDKITDQALAAIQAEVKLLSQLVLDVQESAQIERAEFDVLPRPYPIDALLADAAVFGRSLGGFHPVIVNGLPGRVMADPDRIGQVLRNLLDNAAKYSETGTLIELRAHRAAERVYFEVIDQGVGLAPDEQSRVFGKFERGSGSVSGQQRGVGLGLYLARRIVALHGGTLVVESSPGAGSTFRFDLRTVA